MSGVGVLPRSLAPLPDESITGFLLRLAHRLDTSPLRVARSTGLLAGQSTARIPARVLLEMTTDTAARFATATRTSIGEAAGLTLATLRGSFPPVDPGFGFHRRPGGAGRTVNGVFVQERWLLARSSQYCPHCLAGDGSTIQQEHGGAWNKLWHLPVVFACPAHLRLLDHTCPACAQPALSRSSATGLLRPAIDVLHPAACRNRPAAPDPHCRDSCGHRLDTTPVAEHDLDLGPLLTLQNRLLRLLHGDRATASAGRPATAAQYFIDLRVLACLITASWPAADTLVRAAGHGDLIDAHVQHTRRHIEQARRAGRKARDHAHYDTPPPGAVSCAALLSAAETITRADDPESVRDLVAPLLAGLPATGRDWIKQFLHGNGHCSPGLHTALGPAVGAAHIVARTGISSFTAKRRYPQPRAVRFGLHHIPQRIPTGWIDAYFLAFTDLPPRPLHHVIAAHLAHIVRGGVPTNTSLSQAVLPLGMSRWATTYALAHIRDRLADTGRQTAFDQAVTALAEHLDATRHDLPNYGQRRHALADWSIPVADWTRLTTGLPTRIQTSTWRWRHLPWDERERILASVWIWYHATHGDRTYNRHMRRDWTNLGRVSPTAKYVTSRWRQLADGDGLYQPLREATRALPGRHHRTRRRRSATEYARCRRVRQDNHRLSPHLGATEPGHVMPDPLECLLVVSAGARRIADDPRVESPATGQRQTEADELQPPVFRMSTKLGTGQHEAAVPVHRQPSRPASISTEEGICGRICGWDELAFSARGPHLWQTRQQQAGDVKGAADR